MPKNRIIYYAFSAALSLLALIYCAMVYRAGQFDGLSLGGSFLQGLPNFYFFYALILPFIGASVFYLALTNRYTRLFGALSSELEEKQRNRVTRFRTLLLIVSVVFSVLITIEDALDKQSALAPINFSLPEKAGEPIVANCYACLKAWPQCNSTLNSCTGEGDYITQLQAYGFEGSTASGFDSISAWLNYSSALYKLEVLLNFFAAFIFCIFFSEVFLLVTVKGHVKQASVNLVVWMVVLTTFWFPTKIYAAWYGSIGNFEAPAIFWVGILVLVVGVLLVFFLKTEKNDLYKYGSIIAALASTAFALVSYLQPELLQKIVNVVGNAAVTYIVVVAFLLMFSLYLVTDYFISNYEEEN